MRVALITSRTARELVESYARASATTTGLEVAVVDLPVHAISMLSAEAIARIIGGRRELLEKLRGYDMVLVPGSVPGDARVIAEVIGRPVYKASKALTLLPQVLKHVASGGSLDTVEYAERILPLTPPPIGYVEAFKINGVSIPLRGPPLVISAEVPYRAPDDRIGEYVARYAREGAQIIVVGASFDMSVEKLSGRVSLAVELGYPVLAEAPTGEHARAALDSGASGLIVSADNVDRSAGYLGSEGVLVVGDRSFEAIVGAVERAREVGVSKIAVDPVVGIPLVDFSSTVDRYRRASQLNLPMVFSSANVVEEVEADSLGVHALLAVLAVELGASIYHVVEDSYKTIHSVSEAREALRLATEAYRRGETMRGYYSRLLVVKQANPPEKPTIGPGERVDYVEPRWDRRGYVRIEVDHERGVIVAAYIGYKGGIVVVEGTHGPSLARALARKAGLDPEHAAYLGYELAKAELALRLGKSYIQDEDLVAVPWG